MACWPLFKLRLLRSVGATNLSVLRPRNPNYSRLFLPQCGTPIWAPFGHARHNQPEAVLTEDTRFKEELSMQALSQRPAVEEAEETVSSTSSWSWHKVFRTAQKLFKNQIVCIGAFGIAAALLWHRVTMIWCMSSAPEYLEGNTNTKICQR